MILPPSSPQTRPAKPVAELDKGGGGIDKIQPLEGNRSMTLEVTNKPSERGIVTVSEKDKDKTKAGEAALKSVKSNDTIKPPVQPKPKKKRSRAANIANTSAPSSPLSLPFIIFLI